MTETETKIKEDLSIDETNLVGELQRQASKFFYWATMRAKASAKTRSQKTYLDAFKAETAKKFKEEMAMDPKFKATERVLDDFLDTNEEVKKVKEALINAQYAEEVFDAAEEAMRQRHYALIELTRSKEAERMNSNEYETMKREFEARDAKKRG
jgi:predicted fused transcriptional regulator/phosphomethylpyrimidine kinase